MNQTLRNTLSLMLFLLPMSLQAVIINSADGTGNITAPVDDFGFANVGTIGSLSGVYIGDGWVLTAGHVGAGDITLQGSTYSYDGVSNYTIGTADLRLFRIENYDDLTLDSLTISSTAPTVGDEVYMAGNGRNRASDLTTWYVDTNTDPWTWDESPFAGQDGTLKGYKWDSGYSTRWGTNNVTSLVDAVSANDFITDTIVTTFDQSGGDNECVIATGDSGGGLFYYNESTSEWELAGINILLGTYSGQPDSTAVYGDLSYAVNLANYADEINAIIYAVPEPSDYAACLGLLSLLWILRRVR